MGLVAVSFMFAAAALSFMDWRASSRRAAEARARVRTLEQKHDDRRRKLEEIGRVASDIEDAAQKASDSLVAAMAKRRAMAVEKGELEKWRAGFRDPRLTPAKLRALAEMVAGNDALRHDVLCALQDVTGVALGLSADVVPTTAVLDAAVDTYDAARPADRPRKPAMPKNPAEALRLAAESAKSAQDRMVSIIARSHRAASREGKRAEWRKTILAADDVVPALRGLLDDATGAEMRSDLVWCLQQASGVALGVTEGSLLTDARVAAALETYDRTAKQQEP
jgi:hypothetical protein